MAKQHDKNKKIGKNGNFFKPRVPLPPPTKVFKSKKDYDRSKNKRIERRIFDEQ